MQDYRKLAVWTKAHALTLAVYRATEAFPKHEIYSLTSQLRRCSSSVPSSIAEGCGRSGNAELLKFLHYSMGSAKELDYQLLLSHDLGYIADAPYEELTVAVGEASWMLSALISKLKQGG
jgi:four helix bundle protein